MRTPPPSRDDLRFYNRTGILQKKKTVWFIGVEAEQETSAPPPKKNPESAPEHGDVTMTPKRQLFTLFFTCFCFSKSLVIHF